MEEEKKEEIEIKDEKSKGKEFNKILLIIVGIALILVGLCFGFLLGRGKTTNTNDEPDNNEQTDKPEEDEETIINELINIADLNTTATDEFFAPLLYNNGVINEFDNETKINIIYRYAKRNVTITEITGDAVDGCSDGGNDSCDGIKISDFDNIAKKYGITDYSFNGQTYEDMYLFSYGGNQTIYKSVSHNISTNKGEDGYTITDKLMFTAIDPSSIPNKEVVKEFTFKKNEDGYYLYSINTISETEIIETEDDLDLDQMKIDLKNQIKTNGKNAYIVKCTDKATEDNPFDKDEVYIELSEETIDIIIDKLKTATSYSKQTRGYLNCPPNNIMYYIGGTTYYEDKVFILDYDTNNTFAFGYNSEGYVFEFENNLTGFIESLETYKK